MFELPTYVIVDNKKLNIRNNGDYRMVLDCFVALEDSELAPNERVLASLMIFYDDINSVEDLSLVFGDDATNAEKEMFKFFNCGQENPGAATNYKLVDWNQDAPLIASAINNVANMEVRALPYLHWWTFMGYYQAIGDSAFTTIVSIRNKIKTGKSLEKYEKEFKKNNPHYFVWDSKSPDEKNMDDYVRNMWNG